MTETEEWGPYRNGPANQISGEEWDIVCAVEQFWHTNRYFPSNKEISEETVTPVERVAELLESPAVKTRLEARGINYDASPPAKKGELKKNLTRLTDKQLATAMCILNVADTRSIQEKLRTLGVPEATYYGWTKSKVFQEFMETQMEDMFGDAMPLAHRAICAPSNFSMNSLAGTSLRKMRPFRMLRFWFFGLLRFFSVTSKIP
jgi:hypothetical protein